MGLSPIALCSLHTVLLEVMLTVCGAMVGGTCHEEETMKMIRGLSISHTKTG